MQRFGASPHYALRTGSSPLYPRLLAARVSSRSDEMGAITSGECPNVQVQNPKPIRLAVPEHSTPTVETPRNSASFWGKLSDQEGNRSLRYKGKPAVGGISMAESEVSMRLGFTLCQADHASHNQNGSEHLRTIEDLPKEWHRNNYHTNHFKV